MRKYRVVTMAVFLLFLSSCGKTENSNMSQNNGTFNIADIAEYRCSIDALYPLDIPPENERRAHDFLRAIIDKKLKTAVMQRDSACAPDFRFFFHNGKGTASRMQMKDVNIKIETYGDPIKIIRIIQYKPIYIDRYYYADQSTRDEIRSLIDFYKPLFFKLRKNRE